MWSWQDPAAARVGGIAVPFFPPLLKPRSKPGENHKKHTIQMEAPGFLQSITAVVTGPARPVFVNAALFAAGVAFLQSPLADFLAPEL